MGLKIAVCDYPEHVNRETWLEFPKRMKAMGLTYVRIGEFAWSKLEPKRDQFAFEWLDEAIEALHAEGLRVVLGTPTATPPAWLIRAHPEIMPVDIHGRVRDFGSRRHYDYSSQIYWQESRRIVEILAKRYGNHPAIAGWQTDNEHGCHDTTRSYSPVAREGFQGWLEQKYGTVAALNEAWGTVFWSQDYSSFGEIGLHNLTVTEPNPSHVLDFYRYSSDQVVAYDRMQTAILREHSPGRFVTHNFMIFFSDFDHFKAAEHLDFVTWDNYPTGMLEFFAPSGVGEEVKTAFARTGHPDMVSFNHDIYRGLKTDSEGRGVGFWVMEQQCGQVNWATWNPLPAPGAVKLWTLQAMAHGADVVSYFRWQAATEAQELMHSGLLRYDGSDDRGALEVASLTPKLEGISDAPVETKVALLHDYESLWAYDVQKHAADSSYWGQTMMFYMALRGLGLDVDIRHPSSDLSRYAVVIAPALHILSTDTADNLERYVRSGGQLVLGPRSGFRMPTGAVWKSRAPGPLAELAGVKVQNFDSLRPGLTSRVEAFDSSYNTRTWNESLEVISDDVQVLGTYSNDPLYGLAAVTHRRQDAGGTTYIGAWDEGLIASTLMHILGIASVKYMILEPGLRISRRGGYIYAQNWSRGGMPAPAPEGTKFVIGEALLEPAGVAVWQDKSQ